MGKNVLSLPFSKVWVLLKYSMILYFKLLHPCPSSYTINALKVLKRQGKLSAANKGSLIFIWTSKCIVLREMYEESTLQPLCTRGWDWVFNELFLNLEKKGAKKVRFNPRAIRDWDWFLSELFWRELSQKVHSVTLLRPEMGLVFSELFWRETIPKYTVTHVRPEI
jgi:hypothetical protein